MTPLCEDRTISAIVERAVIAKRGYLCKNYPLVNNIQAERATNLGRIDAVLDLADTVYILEFKMTTGDTALQQIRDKQYAQPFLSSGKMISLLGIAFDHKLRNIADWQQEIVTPTG